VVIWGVVGGLAGVVLTVLWAFTDHAMAYSNENLFQVNPVLLSLALVAPFGLREGTRAGGRSRKLAVLLAGLSVLGFVLQALPGVDQVNGPVIALLLPIHLGVAAGLWLATRPAAAPVPPPPPRSPGTR
jgi:hypothetical protein